MCFFRRKEWHYTPMDRPVDTICVHLCDYFWELESEKQGPDPEKNVITTRPYFNDHDLSLWKRSQRATTRSFGDDGLSAGSGLNRLTFSINPMR